MYPEEYFFVVDKPQEFNYKTFKVRTFPDADTQSTLIRMEYSPPYAAWGTDTPPGYALEQRIMYSVLYSERGHRIFNSTLEDMYHTISFEASRLQWAIPANERKPTEKKARHVSSVIPWTSDFLN